MTAMEPIMEVRRLCGGYGNLTVLRDVSFEVPPNKIMAIVGGSGCGKSTLMRFLCGLLDPFSGTIHYRGTSLLDAEGKDRENILRRFGILFQGGALWSSMTVGENVALPMQEHTRWDPAHVQSLVRVKLAQVGLAGSEELYPAALSGGMRKRAALARAMALDPDILFLDEPGAGLDPVSLRKQDRLVASLRDQAGTTVIMVTHELESILSIADEILMLSPRAKGIIARGDPRELKKDPPHPEVAEFFQLSTQPSSHHGSKN